MRFVCPECGAAQRGPAAGAVVACTACGNPVVVPPPAPEAPEPTAPQAPRGSPWGTACLVLLIVAAAHVGLYLLLTADARGGMRSLEARHGREALEHARRPEEAPAPDSPDYRAWRESVERHDDAHAWRNHRRHVALLRGGFIASFLVQAGITAWILARILQRRRAAARRGAENAG